MTPFMIETVFIIGTAYVIALIGCIIIDLLHEYRQDKALQRVQWKPRDYTRGKP